MTATYWPKNTATLSGVSDGSTDTTTAVAWQRIGTDAGIDTEHAYVINKVDSSNYAKGLEGAVFTGFIRLMVIVMIAMMKSSENMSVMKMDIFRFQKH
mgnify:CR=1 FL=1